MSTLYHNLIKGECILSTIILGSLTNSEYEKKYNKNNKQSKHMIDRKERIELSLANAKPISYYEVFRTKDKSRQIHCLLEDATLIVFNKKDRNIITVLLLDVKKLKEYLAFNGDLLEDYPATTKCAKLHKRLNFKTLQDEIELIVEKKMSYINK